MRFRGLLRKEKKKKQVKKDKEEFLKIDFPCFKCNRIRYDLVPFQNPTRNPAKIWICEQCLKDRSRSPKGKAPMPQ